MKFRHRPTEIEAQQFFRDIQPWPDGVQHFAHHQIEGKCVVPYPFTPYGMWSTGWFEISTVEGPLKVSDGDWIAIGIHGERYPIKPEIFQKSYDPI